MAEETLEQKLTGTLTTIRDLAAKAEQDGNRDFTDDERATITDLMSKGRDFQAQITRAKTNAAVQEEVRQFISATDAKAVNDEVLAGARQGMGHVRKSLGDTFVDSQQFKSALEPFGTRGVGSTDKFGTNPVPVGGMKALLTTQGGTDAGGVGHLYEPERIAAVELPWQRPTLRDVVTVGQTGSDTVKYAKINRPGVGGTVVNAAGVPEATTSAPVGSGTPAVTPAQAGIKPESAMTFSTETAEVVTIAHWVPATKKALSDAGQLRTLIDNFLRKGLEQKLDEMILSGDSSAGESFDGLINVNGLQTQSFVNNISDTIRKSITKVSKYGARPNAVLVSPGTAERIDLLRDKNGRPLGNGPFGAAVSSIWRTPIVEVPNLSDDTVLVGDFSTAVLWDREEASITATDSHADFFVRNLVAILAEARAAFGVLDPSLIAKVSVAGTDVFA